MSETNVPFYLQFNMNNNQTLQELVEKTEVWNIIYDPEENMEGDWKKVRVFTNRHQYDLVIDIIDV